MKRVTVLVELDVPDEYTFSDVQDVIMDAISDSDLLSELDMEDDPIVRVTQVKETK